MKIESNTMQNQEKYNYKQLHLFRKRVNDKNECNGQEKYKPVTKAKISGV